jgi:hypothetical protein
MAAAREPTLTGLPAGASSGVSPSSRRTAPSFLASAGRGWVADQICGLACSRVISPSRRRPSRCSSTPPFAVTPAELANAPRVHPSFGGRFRRTASSSRRRGREPNTQSRSERVCEPRLKSTSDLRNSFLASAHNPLTFGSSTAVRPKRPQGSGPRSARAGPEYLRDDVSRRGGPGISSLPGGHQNTRPLPGCCRLPAH